MSGKEHDDGLDASFIISQAKSRNRPLHPYTPEKEEEASALSEPSGEAASSSATKEEGRRRRGKGQDYERLFIRNAPSNTRSGKTVYIRKEFHERITRIVQVIGKNERKYSINSLVYWVTYVHNVVYSFYRSMIYCYINSTQRCAGSIVIDIIPTNGADKRKFFPFAPYFPVTNVIKRYFYPYFPAIIGIKGYSFPYFPYLSGIMKIKT